MTDLYDNWEYGTHVIYRHSSPSEKSYIGYTKHKDRRAEEHARSNGSNPAFHNAVKLYGWDNIKTEILEEQLILSEAKELEKYYIKLFDTRKNGYNCTDGGDGNGAKVGKDNVRATAIRALNVLTMEELKFDTIKEAAEHYKIHPAIISIIIKNIEIPDSKYKGCLLASNTYTFQKYDPKNPDKSFDLTKLRTKEEKTTLYAELRKDYSKAVIGTHILGFSVEYNSTHEAERKHGFQHGYVSRNARGKLGPVEGFSWLFKDLEERAKYPVWSFASRVGAPGISIIWTNGDVITEFDSIKDAVTQTNTSRKMINKSIETKNKDKNGFYWYKK